MSRRNLLAGLAIVAAVLGTSLVIGRDKPAERRPEHFVRHVTGSAKKERLGDLAALLRVEQLEGRVELNSGFRNATLVLAAYKDGRKVDLPESEVPLGASYETNGTIVYAVQIADLDFLPLGDGKKKHCRVRVSFRWPDESTAFVETDVPKDVIDLSGSSNQSFTGAANTDRVVPLWWLRKGKEIKLQLKTPEEVIAGHKEGAILLLSLRFNDPERGKK
jgi:hypothetical protein